MKQIYYLLVFLYFAILQFLVTSLSLIYISVDIFPERHQTKHLLPSHKKHNCKLLRLSQMNLVVAAAIRKESSDIKCSWRRLEAEAVIWTSVLIFFWCIYFQKDSSVGRKGNFFIKSDEHFCLCES